MSSDKTPYNISIQYLSRREHSARELKQKLKQKKFSDSDIDQVLTLLQEKNFQSDERFVENYVHYRKQYGFGPLRIIAELQEKGVSDSLIRQYVDKNNDEWRTQLRDVFKKKFSAKGSSLKEKEKQCRFLYSRGFSADDIRALFE